MQKLTKRQREVLDFIKRYIEDNGFAPTLQEIADGLGYGHGPIQYHINALIHKKKLARADGNARGIWLVDIPKRQTVVIANRRIEVGIPGTSIVRVR